MSSEDEYSHSENEQEHEVAQPQVIEDCSNSDVVTKYRLASEIAQSALHGILSQLCDGKDILEVCQFGDLIIEKRCSTIFKSKKIVKGIAFPTSLSLNEIMCHFSPLQKESMKMKAGDWIKIDLGCHVDGYIAVVAHTVIVPATATATVPFPFPVLKEKEADVFKCAYDALELCTRLIKPGNTNHQVTEALTRLEQAYGVKAIQGTVMHQIKRFVIDGAKMIACKNDVENKPAKCTFEPNEAYTIDICYTTGNDKPVHSERRTTIFKRQVEKNYRLKMKASRYVLSEINQKCPTLPFTIGLFQDETQARMGVVECVKHDLLSPYPILEGKPGDRVVHLKATVLLLPTGTKRITGLSIPLDHLQTQKKPDETNAAILATSSKKKNKKKKKKKTTTTHVQE